MLLRLFSVYYTYFVSLLKMIYSDTMVGTEKGEIPTRPGVSNAVNLLFFRLLPTNGP